MSTVLTQPMTAADFWRLPETEKRRELVRGEVIETMPPGMFPGAIVANLVELLRGWTKQGTDGYVGVEAGYILERNPDTVRAPDVSYVTSERIQAVGIPEGFWEGAPDVAVEIISRNETADEVREKVRDDLSAGAALVLTIYPRTREVIAHIPDGLARTFGPDASLEFPTALPGFTCRVAELFA
ncbi:MAG TPA: Uma2 family endonuclease [Caldilineaceae bacterium]|nr:Uma2 family endonuclease [Caldilineaceae bacterium]